MLGYHGYSTRNNTSIHPNRDHYKWVSLVNLAASSGVAHVSLEFIMLSLCAAYPGLLYASIEGLRLLSEHPAVLALLKPDEASPMKPSDDRDQALIVSLIRRLFRSISWLPSVWAVAKCKNTCNCKDGMNAMKC